MAVQELLEQAKQLGGHKTKRETIDFDPTFLAEMDRRS